MKITIFGRPNCPYCERSIELCENKNIEFDYLSVGDFITKEELIEKIHKVTGDDSIVVRTVPQIFMIDDDGTERYIKGGFEGLREQLNR